MAYIHWLITQKRSVLDDWMDSENAPVVPNILKDETCTIYWPYEKTKK